MKTITIDARKINDSGIGRYIRNLVPLIIEELSEYNFNLLGDIQEMNSFIWTKNDNIRLINCKLKNYSISEQINLVKFIPKNTNLYFAPFYNIPIFYSGKIVTTVHDVAHLVRPEYSLLKKIYAKLMLNFVQSKSAFILTVSEFSKNEILKYIKVKNKDKIKVIYNGIGNDWLHASKGLNPYIKPYLLYVGNIKPHKNLISLLNAFELIKDKIPHDLVIIGRKEGFITGDYNVFQKAIQLEDRISFTGLIDDNMLKQFYSHTDALVFPTLYEGFGLPVIEAMACRCPVIASNIPSLLEIFDNKVLYFDPYNYEDIADKIIKLLSDKELRKSQIAKGFNKVKEFNWSKSAKSICEIFKQAL